MRPEQEKASAEALIRVARHYTLRANIGIHIDGIRPKVTLGLLNTLTLLKGSGK